MISNLNRIWITMDRHFVSNNLGCTLSNSNVRTSNTYSRGLQGSGRIQVSIGSGQGWNFKLCRCWKCSLKYGRHFCPGPNFIKPDQLDPWIKDEIKIILLSAISSLQLPNFVACGRDKPSHRTQNFVTVGAKLWTAEHVLVDPWSTDQADLVW